MWKWSLEERGSWVLNLAFLPLTDCLPSSTECGGFFPAEYQKLSMLGLFPRVVIFQQEVLAAVSLQYHYIRTTTKTEWENASPVRRVLDRVTPHQPLWTGHSYKNWFLLWLIQSTYTVLETTWELSMWYHFRNRFLYHTNKDNWRTRAQCGQGPGGNEAKCRTPGCMGVALYFSFRVITGLCFGRFLTANYKIWNFNNVENHSYKAFLGLYNSCKVPSSLISKLLTGQLRTDSPVESSRCCLCWRHSLSTVGRQSWLRCSPCCHLLGA